MEINCDHQALNNILDQCEENVVGVVNDKAYLNSNKIMCFQDQFFLVTDYQSWIPLKALQQDDTGFYVLAQSLRCDRGHRAFKRVWGTWYCLNEDCYYYYFRHFD